jgi:hypothetical protein
MLLCGKTPFYGKDDQIAKMIRSGKVEFKREDWKKVNSDAISYVNYLLTHNVD